MGAAPKSPWGLPLCPPLCLCGGTQLTWVLRFRFAGSGVGRVLVQVFNAVFVDEKIRLRFAGDANDVLIVVFDPAANFFAVDKLHDDGSPVFRQTVDVLGLAESRFWRGLPPISAARVLM